MYDAAGFAISQSFINTCWLENAREKKATKRLWQIALFPILALVLGRLLVKQAFRRCGTQGRANQWKN